MIQGVKIAGTLIYFIPACVNFFFSGKPRISFIYIINDITCFFEDTGALLNATDPESKSVLELFQRKEGEGTEGRRRSGVLVLSLRRVRVKPEYTVKRRLGPTAVCPSCGEAYPLRDGSPCLACQGRSPYINENA